MLHFNVQIEIKSRKTTACLKIVTKYVDPTQIDNIMLIFTFIIWFLVTGKGTNVTSKTWKVPCSEFELDFFTIHEFQYKTASPLMKLDAFF